MVFRDPVSTILCISDLLLDYILSQPLYTINDNILTIDFIMAFHCLFVLYTQTLFTREFCKKFIIVQYILYLHGKQNICPPSVHFTNLT